VSSRVVFSAGRHTYSLDGSWVPGVTSVARFASRPDGLIRWSAREAAAWAAANVDALPVLGPEEWQKTAATASDRVRDRSMLAGTQVHSLAEALVYGSELPAEDPNGLPWPEDVFRTAEQLARFYDAWNVEPVAHELIVFHESHRWAGRLDLIADLRDGARWLLDYKTGATGVWPETTLQLNAYKRATHCQLGGDDVAMFAVDRLAAVWLRPDSWELIPLEDDDEHYSTFGHAMRVAAWVNRRAKSSVLPPLPIPSEEAS
jgi:hypothetical protein